MAARVVTALGCAALHVCADWAAGCCRQSTSSDPTKILIECANAKGHVNLDPNSKESDPVVTYKTIDCAAHQKDKTDWAYGYWSPVVVQYDVKDKKTDTRALTDGFTSNCCSKNPPSDINDCCSKDQDLATCAGTRGSTGGSAECHCLGKGDTWHVYHNNKYQYADCTWSS